MFPNVFVMCSSRKYPYPPHGRDWKFRRGGGGQRPRNFRRGGGGVDSRKFFFFPDRLNIIFIQLYVKFRCLHFASRVADAKKINLANLKHKMHIFALVWLDILSPLESDHFPE